MCRQTPDFYPSAPHWGRRPPARAPKTAGQPEKRAPRETGVAIAYSLRSADANWKYVGVGEKRGISGAHQGLGCVVIIVGRRLAPPRATHQHPYNDSSPCGDLASPLQIALPMRRAPDRIPRHQRYRGRYSNLRICAPVPFPDIPRLLTPPPRFRRRRPNRRAGITGDYISPNSRANRHGAQVRRGFGPSRGGCFSRETASGALPGYTLANMATQRGELPGCSLGPLGAPSAFPGDGRARARRRIWTPAREIRMVISRRILAPRPHSPGNRLGVSGEFALEDGPNQPVLADKAHTSQSGKLPAEWPGRPKYRIQGKSKITPFNIGNQTD